MRKSPSGSPEAWQLRRKAYRQTANQVSNPGQPSPCNRQARRRDYYAAWDEAVVEDAGRVEHQIDQMLEAQDVKAEMFPEEG